MDDIFPDGIDKKVKIYLDNIIMWEDSYEGMFESLEYVLRRYHEVILAM